MPRRALVTGGSGVLGSAICEELSRAGLHVIVHANRQPARALDVSERIRRSGGSAETVCFELTDPDATQHEIETLTAAEPLQVLVHSAGVNDDAPMAGMSRQQWRHVVDVSLNGFFNVTQPALLPMIRTRWGRIIVLSSVSALLGNRGQTNYAAAKAGLHGAVKSLAREIGSRGITVNAVAPGLIESDMTAGVFTPEQIRGLVPMRKMGTPADVAYLVAFLASDKAGYISGQVIGVNGAMV
jgi:3-oxoacyl-[acyl-carrier protein] reductase